MVKEIEDGKPITHQHTCRIIPKKIPVEILFDFHITLQDTSTILGVFGHLNHHTLPQSNQRSENKH